MTADFFLLIIPGYPLHAGIYGRRGVLFCLYGTVKKWLYFGLLAV